MTQQSLTRSVEVAAGSSTTPRASVPQIEVPMSLSVSDGSDFSPQTFAGLDTHGMSLVHDDLPEHWEDGGAVYVLHRLDATSWSVTLDGLVLGILSHVPPLALGGAETWKIGDPQQQNLGVGASWPSWQDAVENLVDYRRRQ